MEQELVVLTRSLFFSHFSSFLPLISSFHLPSSQSILNIFPTYRNSLHTLSLVSGRMDAGKFGKAVKRETAEDYEEKNGWSEQDKKKIGGSGKKAVSSATRCCQAEKCTVDLNDAKHYYRRHRVCEHHAKAQVVLVGGIRQRFCQQCSRFGEIP